MTARTPSSSATANRPPLVTLIIVAANVAMLIVDRMFAPGAALVTFLASAVALAVAPWRAVRRPPVIAAIIALVGLSIIELVDLGALSTLRIRL